MGELCCGDCGDSGGVIAGDCAKVRLPLDLLLVLLRPMDLVNSFSLALAPLLPLLPPLKII